MERGEQISKILIGRISRTMPLPKKCSKLEDVARLCCPEAVSSYLEMMMKYVDRQCSLWGSDDVTGF